MYPQPPSGLTKREREAWESLNHSDGEEYPGQYDPERQMLRDAGFDPRDHWFLRTTGGDE